MKTRNLSTLTYESCRHLVDNKRYNPVTGVKIAHNTHLFYDPANSRYLITLHGNTILAVHYDDSHSLYDGGFQSVTTKQRLNALSHCGVYQRAHQWYVPTSIGDVRFVDGIRVNTDGTLHGAFLMACREACHRNGIPADDMTDAQVIELVS